MANFIMNPHIALSVVLAGSCLLAGCGRPTSSENWEDIIATVDGKPIPRSALESELTRLSRSGRAPEPRQVLETLLQRERLAARAARLGLDQDPEVRRSFQTVLIAKLKERELEPKLRSLTVSEEDLLAAKETRINKPTGMPQMRLAILRLQINPKASPSKLKAAETRLAEARAKAGHLPPETVGFGQLAIDYSDDDATRYRGGDLGWLDTDPSKYYFDEAMLAAGFALRNVRDISPIIRGKDGLYLVRVIARRQKAANATKTDDELARHSAQIEKRRALENAFAEETRQMIPVSVNSAAVRKLTGGRARAAAGEPPGLPASAPTVVNLNH